MQSSFLHFFKRVGRSVLESVWSSVLDVFKLTGMEMTSELRAHKGLKGQNWEDAAEPH